ncbi:MAG: hypothetical protein KY437_01270 [Actinobacteria bacterium]|nr:hypothetical protein [Actinomycetota bacterium]
MVSRTGGPVEPIALSEATTTIAGILFIALVTVETGGLYLVRLARGSTPATDLQVSFARAGHAHAGVLLILSLVGLLYADAVGLEGLLGTLARSGVPVAALLMPAGFFFSSMGRARTSPNRLIALVYLGGISLAVGLLALAVGLLRGT